MFKSSRPDKQKRRFYGVAFPFGINSGINVFVFLLKSFCLKFIESPKLLLFMCREVQCVCAVCPKCGAAFSNTQEREKNLRQPENETILKKPGDVQSVRDAIRSLKRIVANLEKSLSLKT